MPEGAVQTAEDLAAAIEAVRAVEQVERPTNASVDGASFDATSANGVRARHAEDALANADDVQVLEYQDTRMFIATSFVDIGSPFVLLVVGGQQDQEWHIRSAYRVYAEDAVELAKNACLVFQTFLVQFGLHFRAQDRWVLFAPVLTAKPDADGELSLIELKELDEERDWTLSASMRRNVDGTATVAWPFAIDTTKYKRELKRHQR